MDVTSLVSYRQKKLVKVSVIHTSTVPCTNVMLEMNPLTMTAPATLDLVFPMRQLTNETNVRCQKSVLWPKRASRPKCVTNQAQMPDLRDCVIRSHFA